MHYHVETNALICRIKRLDETHLGGFSLHQSLPETATLLLESLLLKIDISLTTIYILQVEPAVTSHLQLINQEDIYI
jgi:hypothetical protein